jgi:hypothetical protein
MTDLDRTNLDRILPSTTGSPDWADVMSRSRAQLGRLRRRVVVALAAGALVALGTASAFGSVREFVRDVGFIGLAEPAGVHPPAATRPVLTEAGVRFSFRVPRSWSRYNTIPTKKSPGGPISLNKSIAGPQDAEAIIYWTSFPNGDHADRCARELAPSIGRSADSLAAAVSTAPGTTLVKGPLNVTVGGHPAKHVVLTVRKHVGCDPGFFYTWPDVSGGDLWPTTSVGDTIRVWIVPVAATSFYKRTRLFIAAATKEDADAKLKREVERIVGSFRFESVVLRAGADSG